MRRRKPVVSLHFSFRILSGSADGKDNNRLHFYSSALAGQQPGKSLFRLKVHSWKGDLSVRGTERESKVQNIKLE